MVRHGRIGSASLPVLRFIARRLPGGRRGMKHRYTINERGELIAGDGACLGRITEIKLTLEDSPDHAAKVEVEALTLDDFPAPLARADARPPEGGQTSTATSKATATSKSKSKSTTLRENDLDVQAAWAYWCERRQPRFPKLEASQANLIRKGIDAVGDGGLRTAIEGLLASDWHREHNQLQLSTILKTRPGGPTLRDQLEMWMERAPSSPEQLTSTAQVGGNGRLLNLRRELGKYESLPQEQLRPGDIERIAELRALIAELGEL
jgi:hypothetical protein